MSYKYKDPTVNGFTRFKLSRKVHNQLLPRRKLNWLKKCNYYYNDDKIIIEFLTSIMGIVLVTILLPVSILFAGLSNFKEVIRDYKRILNEKKYGAYTTEYIYKRSLEKLYNDIIGKRKS